MAHSADGLMSGDCPLATDISFSRCALGTLDMVIYHISAYHSFLSAPASYGGVTMLVASFVFLALTFVVLITRLRFTIPISLEIILSHYFNLAVFSYKNVIGRWLSLLEHSPSL